MKEMIKRMREEKGGFTLAELLIVVAIVMVLVAIAIPVFSGAMAEANRSTDTANIRSGWAQAQVCAMTKKDPAGVAITTTQKYRLLADGTLGAADAANRYVTRGSATTADVTNLPGGITEWTAGQNIQYTLEAQANGDYTVTIQPIAP